MLSQQERDEISVEINRYEKKKSACIDALRIVQHHRGWISDESVADIAEFLQMSPTDVDGIATFYNLIFRRPVGKHVLFVCDSVSCWIMGCDILKLCLKEELGIGMGETTSDHNFTLLPIACLGRCEEAPVLFVDGEPFSKADVSSLKNLLNQIRKKDTERKTA